jgi:hypothetical protein
MIADAPKAHNTRQTAKGRKRGKFIQVLLKMISGMAGSNAPIIGHREAFTAKLAQPY